MKAFFKNSIIMAILALIIFTLPIGSFVAKADEKKAEAYEMKISSGIEGKYRALKYIPVTVEFTSSEKDFSGEVEIRTSGSYTSTYDAYSKEISVAKGEIGKVTIPIKLLEGSSKITVNLVENGKVLFEKKSLISNGRVSEANLFMGILTDDPTALSYTGSILFDINMPYKGIQETQGTIEKVQLDEKLIGENSLNIDGLNVIFINNYNMANLKKEQYIALNSWLNKGGTLIIGAGANESKTINNIDSDFLDIKSKGNKEKSVKIVDENLNLIFSDLEVKGGKIKIGDNENPLAYSFEKGKGEILVTTFDLGLEPFISSKDSKNFINSLLSETINNMNNINYNGGYGQGYYRTSELTRYIPINEIVGTKSLISVLLIYVAVIGIVIYIVLKKINKRDFTWVVIPLASIVFTLVIYFMGSKTRVNDIVLNQNNIISVDKDGKSSVKGYLGVGTKYKSDVIIEKPEDLTMNYSTIDNYYYGGQEEEISNVLRVKTTYSGNNSYFTFHNSDALDMRSFEVTGKEEVLSRIESEFRLSEGNLNGKVKNTSGYDINRLLLVAGRNIWDMGAMKKDEEKEISELKTVGVASLQAYADKLNQKYYDIRNQKENLESDEFKNIVRVSALIGAVSDEIYNSKGTKLIAITDLPIEYGINFGKKSISKFDTTAVIQDSELEFKDKNGDYNFPDGYFEGTVESASSNVHIDEYNGYIYGQGDVVLNYEVDNNIEIIDLIIKQGVDRYGYSGQDSADRYIYNYKTDSYDKLNMYNGYEKIADLENYINNNNIKIKYTVDDMKGQSMIPMITVKGRER
ncbi:MAG: hypothetical protein HUJ77_03735 [Clostridium sp.]|uniref:hypothetical protein n=1 Tax=Clostridium sp. TaxID=1506 RepID=UPI0025BF4814|nr:hypothetical protein [Clostridium sp.]MCF0147489.1 hypothetical protein [Clostridium sp.]